jgi:hypothetical protein
MKITIRTLCFGLSVVTCLAVTATAQAEVTFNPIIIDNPDPQPNTGFGHGLAPVGDVDGDGTPDFLVGARYQDVNGNVDQGRAYLFSGATLELLLTIENPSLPGVGANFGRWVSAVGDITGDRVPDLLIGAPFQEIDGIFQAGQAHVFSGSTGELVYTLDNPSPETKDHFGLVVSPAGDLNNDRVGDMFVGAHFKDIDGKIDQGQAYVFSGATGELMLTLDTPKPIASAYFGFPVAHIGDLNGDNVPDLLVGATFHAANGNIRQGRAFAFSGATGELLHILDDPFPHRGAKFGMALSPSDDIDGDAVPDIIVGAQKQFDDWNRGQGMAFIFSGRTGKFLRALSDPNPAPTAWFGTAVAGMADVDGDRVGDVLVGAVFQEVDQNAQQGQAFLFSSVTGDLLYTFDNPFPQPDAGFGHQIVPIGDTNGDGVPEVLIGAFQQDVDSAPVRYCTTDGPPLQLLIQNRYPDMEARSAGNEDQGQVFLFESRVQ